jgi:hypothetical protein
MNAKRTSNGLASAPPLPSSMALALPVPLRVAEIGRRSNWRRAGGITTTLWGKETRSGAGAGGCWSIGSVETRWSRRSSEASGEGRGPWFVRRNRTTSLLSTGSGMRTSLLLRSVASVRSVRQHQVRPLLSSSESARRRRAVPNGHGLNSQPRLRQSMRGGVVVSFDRAASRIFDRARLDRVAAVAVCERRVQAGGEHAVRLGAQELRPAGADPPWRRPETRASEHVRDRGGRDADPELEQLALDTDVTQLGFSLPGGTIRLRV